MTKYNFTKEGFTELFSKIRLTQLEIDYFTEDMQDALTLEFESVNQYYRNKETQFCMRTYTKPDYKRVMKSGLDKINNHLNIEWYNFNLQVDTATNPSL